MPCSGFVAQHGVEVSYDTAITGLLTPLSMDFKAAAVMRRESVILAHIKTLITELTPDYPMPSLSLDGGNLSTAHHGSLFSCSLVLCD